AILGKIAFSHPIPLGRITATTSKFGPARMATAGVGPQRSLTCGRLSSMLARRGGVTFRRGYHMAAVDVFSSGTGEIGVPPGYLILDTETVPDGRLISMVKYPGEHLTPEQAIAKAQAEARERSWNGSDFLPVSFQYPVAVCI